MNNTNANTITDPKETAPAMPNQFQDWINDPGTQLPITLGKVLTPIHQELGKLTIIHPTTNDPVMISKTHGPVAIWFKF